MAETRRDDDHVAPLEERARGVVAQPVDLLVAGRVLLDVRIGPGEVGLRLEVVVVADEVLDRVLREELLELLVELRGERLVVRHDQRRLLDGLDDLRGRERLAGAGRAEQHLVASGRARCRPTSCGDRRRLVAGRLVGGVDLQVGHGHDSSRRPSVPPPAAPTTYIGTTGPFIRSVGRSPIPHRTRAHAITRCPYNPLAQVPLRRADGRRRGPRRAVDGQAMVEFAAVLLPHAPDRGRHRPVRPPVRRERHAHERGAGGGTGGDDRAVRRRRLASRRTTSTAAPPRSTPRSQSFGILPPARRTSWPPSPARRIGSDLNGDGLSRPMGERRHDRDAVLLDGHADEPVPDDRDVLHHRRSGRVPRPGPAHVPIRHRRAAHGRAPAARRERALRPARRRRRWWSTDAPRPSRAGRCSSSSPSSLVVLLGFARRRGRRRPPVTPSGGTPRPRPMPARWPPAAP